MMTLNTRMTFNPRTLHQKLLSDNPTSERFVRSDLHALVALLDSGGFSVDNVAAEMKKISAAKWAKYSRTRQYLESAFPPLTDLLRARPIGFRTTSMSSLWDDMALKHMIKWKSDTGNLSDLAIAWTREHVTWPLWPAALTACIGDAHAPYRQPGHHTGLVVNPANLGQGEDKHALFGPFNERILNHRGAAVRAPMEQVYEYSYDQVIWFPIPDSRFLMVREVTDLGGGRVQISITKSNQTKPSERFVVKKIV